MYSTRVLQSTYPVCHGGILAVYTQLCSLGKMQCSVLSSMHRYRICDSTTHTYLRPSMCSEKAHSIGGCGQQVWQFEANVGWFFVTFDHLVAWSTLSNTYFTRFGDFVPMKMMMMTTTKITKLITLPLAHARKVTIRNNTNNKLLYSTECS